MASIDVYLESGKKKSFACALDWPGWCLSGRDADTALQALLAYASRYAGVLEQAGIDFQAPENAAQFHVIERLEGNVATDFGAPAVIPAADRLPLEGSCAAVRAAEAETWIRLSVTCSKPRGLTWRASPGVTSPTLP